MIEMVKMKNYIKISDLEILSNISNEKIDLRKKDNLIDLFKLNNYSIQSCMVILFVIGVFLIITISIVTTPNPNIIFGI